MTESDGPQMLSLGREHHAEILDLWQRAGLHIRPEGRDTPEAFARQMATGVQAVIGLRDPQAAGRLVAVVIATHDGRKGWINRLAVDPAYRRRGLALQLIRACEQHFHGLGIEVWAALIEAPNEPSLALLRRAGYHIHPDIVYASRRTRDDA